MQENNMDVWPSMLKEEKGGKIRPLKKQKPFRRRAKKERSLLKAK
jgi:hypothetical protein